MVIANDLAISGTTTLSGNLNLSQNELKNAVLEKLSSFPSSPVEGQMFWHTDNNKPYRYDDSDDDNIVTVPRWRTDTSGATFVVAASDSQNKEGADYVCSGENDDVQIQAAIDALPSGGGKVILMEGEYTLGDHLYPDDNTTLQGQGAGNTILIEKAIIAISVNNIVIRDLQVKDSSYHCIDFQNVSGGLIENCIVENAVDDGIAISGSSTQDVIVKENICRNCVTSSTPSGIELDNGARNVTIIDNACYGNGNVSTTWGGGITLHTHSAEPTLKNILISSNLCYSNVNNLWTDNPVGYGVTMEKIIISENVIYDGSLIGIKINNMYDSLVVDNIVENNTFSIDSNSKNITVDSNIFKGVVIYTAGGRCLFISNHIHDISSSDYGLNVNGQTAIIGNTVTNCGRAGIVINAGSDNSIVADNIVMNNGQAETTNLYGILIRDTENITINPNPVRLIMA